MFVMTAIAESREARLMSLASPASFRRQAFFRGPQDKENHALRQQAIDAGILILIAEQA